MNIYKKAKITSCIAFIFFSLIFIFTRSILVEKNIDNATINAYTGLADQDYIVKKITNNNEFAAGCKTHEIELKNSNILNKLLANTSKYGFVENKDLDDARYPKDKYAIYASHGELRVIYLIVNNYNNHVILQVVKK